MNYNETLHFLLTKAIRRPNARRIRRSERRLQKQINDDFENQIKFLTLEYSRVLSIQKTLDDDFDEIFKKMDDGAMIAAIILESGKIMQLGADYRIRKHRLATLGISFDLGHPEAVKYLEETRPLILSKMKDTTKDAIQPILVDAVKSGTSPQSVARTLTKQFAFSRKRSLLIAANEVGKAYEFGNLQPMKDLEKSGKVKRVQKQWSTVNDDRVTKQCNQYQSQRWINMNENFKSSTTEDESATRDTNPRCRCTTLYKIIP